MSKQKRGKPYTVLCNEKVRKRLKKNGPLVQDGRVEVPVLISSWESTKIATSCWTTIDRGCWNPQKKDASHPKTKKKPQWDRSILNVTETNKTSCFGKKRFFQKKMDLKKFVLWIYFRRGGVTWFPVCINSDFHFAYREDEMRKHSHLTELLLKLLQGIKQNKSRMPKLLQNPEIIVKNSIIILGSTTFHNHSRLGNMFRQQFTMPCL